MSDVRSFFDPDPPAQRHSPESVSAASEIKVNAGTLRAQVLELLQGGPMTDEEMQDALRMNPSTQRPRRIELVRAGMVVKCGRRPTKSGRLAALWGVVE